MELAEKYSMKPWSSSRKGLAGVHAQIEGQRMLIGKTGKGKIGKVANVLVIARPQQFDHVAALIVPRSGHRTRGGADNGLPEAKEAHSGTARWGTLRGRRVVDRNQANLVDDS